MYSKISNLVLGFHGCDETTYKKILYKHEPMVKSVNKYDWLGNGIYFWENNYKRAMEFAVESSKRKNSSIKKPAVIGAVIDLGTCLNLTDSFCLSQVQLAYNVLKYEFKSLNAELPKNINIKNDFDFKLRYLDCAVIQRLHEYNNENGYSAFDSVRGVFLEGNELYKGSGFKNKTHIQLCIVNPNCIKGVFSPQTTKLK